MGRRSWLSREVAALSVFAGVASAFAGMLFFDLPGRPLAGFLTLVTGAIGVLCSAKLYMVPARPSWNTRYTLAEFYFTAVLLGALFVRVDEPHASRWVSWRGRCRSRHAAADAGPQVPHDVAVRNVFELRASSLLLSGVARKRFPASLGTAGRR